MTVEGWFRHLYAKRSAGTLTPAGELCDRTEGRVSASVSLEGKIHYAAGQTAKEELLKKLGAPQPIVSPQPSTPEQLRSS
jgi:hypothetical protein